MAKEHRMYYIKKQEELLDNINVLYVALTRAEEQLYMISQESNRAKKENYPNNMSSFFIKYLMQKQVFDKNSRIEFGNPIKIIAG